MTENARILIDEIDSAIADIKGTAPSPRCGAHEPLSRGVITLLRCQRADLNHTIEDGAERAARMNLAKMCLVKYGVAASIIVIIIAVGWASCHADTVARIVKWVIR